MNTELYCGHCGGALLADVPGGGTPGGGPAAAGGSPTSDARPGASEHFSCRAQLALEPPRYCAQCRRRMKVQVTPLGWSAACSRHGSVAG